MDPKNRKRAKKLCWLSESILELTTPDPQAKSMSKKQSIPVLICEIGKTIWTIFRMTLKK